MEQRIKYALFIHHRWERAWHYAGQYDTEDDAEQALIANFGHLQTLPDHCLQEFTPLDHPPKVI